MITRWRGVIGRRAGTLTGGASLLFANRFLGAFLTYGTQVLMARSMGREALGTYVHAFAWCIILATLCLLGLPTAAVRFLGAAVEAKRPEDVRGFVRFSRKVTLCVSLLVAALGTALIAFHLDGYGSDAAKTWMFSFLALPFFVILRMEAGLAHAFSWLSLYSTPMVLLRPLLLFGFVAACWCAGIDLVSWHVMGVHVLFLAALAFALRKLVARRIEVRVGQGPSHLQPRVWMTTSAPLLLVVLFTSYFPDVHLLMTGPYLNDADLALYFSALRTSFFIGFFLTAVNMAFLPRASRHHARGDRERLQQDLFRSCKVMTWCAGAGLVFLSVFGESVLGLFGPEFRTGSSALVVLAAGHFVRALAGPAAEVLSMTGGQNACLKVYGFSLVVLFAATLLLAPTGIFGVALALSTVSALSAVLLHGIARKRLGVAPSPFLARLGL